MNIIISWIAAEGLEAEPLLRELGLRQVGAANDHREGRYAYAFTRKGWLLFAYRQGRRDTLPSRLSAQRSILAGQVVSVVNHSSVEAWDAGARLWSATHSPGEGVPGFEITGEPPRDALEIKERYTAWQAEEGDGVDCVYEAALELSDRLCGYRADDPHPGPWILLAPAKGAAGPVLSALPEAIRAELWPALVELGWTLAPVTLRATGRAYEASRIRHGRLEVLRFLWRDDRRDLEIIPSYAIVDGDNPGDHLLVSGGIHRNRGGVLHRLKRSLLKGGGPVKSYEEMVRDVVAEERARLPGVDRFISEDAVRVLGGHYAANA